MKVMKKLIQNMGMKYMRFMQGRYGMYGADDLTRFLSWCAVLLDLVGILAGIPLLVLAAGAVLVWMTARICSRNIVRRMEENRKFREVTAGFRHGLLAFRKQAADREHRYYVCPGCRQIVRVPRGHGRIEIRCPKCGRTFTRKS